MTLIVQKYGGTSLATSARIRDVAARIGNERRAGNDVVVVVSAMGDTTDRLLSLAADICPHPDLRELDMLLTTGERISMALLAMALNATGLRSISLTGSQSGIITDGAHTRARILDVKGDRIREGLGDGRIVIVAGFQGVSAAREITTLGRGGSDVTAVALAARFAAARCEIYTDVDGVYTADPGRVPAAHRIPAIDHESMVAYAELGAGVLHARAARWAAREWVPVVVRSSFIPGAGTAVGNPSAGKPGTASGPRREPPTEPPPVIGIGVARNIRLIELDAPPARVAEVLAEGDDSSLRLLLAREGGALAVADTNMAEEIAGRAQAGAIGARAQAEGDIVSIIHRPAIDVGAAIDELIPAAWRIVPHALRAARSSSLVLERRHIDEAVLTLHRALVESPPVLDPA